MTPEELTAPAPITGKTLTDAAARVMLKQLAGLRGFPTTPEGFNAIAKCFRSLVGDATRGQWLCDLILDGCEWFPAPIQMRRMFGKHHKPADGLEEWQVDMSDVMGSSRKRDEA